MDARLLRFIERMLDLGLLKKGDEFVLKRGGKKTIIYITSRSGYEIDTNKGNCHEIQKCFVDHDPLEPEYLQKASEMYEDEGTLEIDEDAEVSIGEDGAYVAAWVFVGKDEVD